MTDQWRFKDECLLRVFTGIKGITPEKIAGYRIAKARFLANALIDSGFATVDQLISAAEAAFKTKYFMLSPEKTDKFGLKLIPEKICRQYSLVPVKLLENEIHVAMLNPSDFNALSDVQALAGRQAVPLFSLPGEIDSCLDQLFSADTLIFDLLDKVEPSDEILVLGEAANVDAREAGVTSPVIKLVNAIISQAYRKHSSDIRIEHEEKDSHVRIRIDGELRNIMKLPRHIATGPVVSRIKIMSNLDVSNHMRPQDGRTKLRIGTTEVGLRVSTLPTSNGEKVVMRILDQSAAEVPFEKLGFAPEVVAGLEKCMASSQGILLVTGPTGSGKTTTLYSVLNRVKSETSNIVTAEDPIEYKLAGINQVQVNEKQGLTFASVLRSVLRQDPDVIMVGEIRDHETADIAFQAAMTGHLVFSTLHTNDSVSTIARLVDMGLDRYKISPGLLAITAQRLVRRLCPHCREKVPSAAADPEVAKALGDHGFAPEYYRPIGCKTCEGNGYSGRTYLVELLSVSQKIKALINSGALSEEITAEALKSGNLHTLTRDALWHLSKGETDIKEINPYVNLKSKAAPAPEAQKAPATIPAATPAAVPAAAAAGGKPRVMAVDDDPVMLVLLKKFIEAAGFETVEACDGEDALTKIAMGPAPDLLMTDVNMPKLNGYDLIKGVRENLGLLDLPIIMLTTEDSDKSQELAFKLGADDYIIKPFKGPLVMARVTAALRRAGRLG